MVAEDLESTPEDKMTTKNYRELAKVQVERELYNEVNNLKAERDNLMDRASTDAEKDEVKKEYDEKIAKLLDTKEERIAKLAAELEFVDVDDTPTKKDNPKKDNPKKDNPKKDNRLWLVLGGILIAALLGFAIYDITSDDEQQKPLATAGNIGVNNTDVPTDPTPPSDTVVQGLVPSATTVAKDDCCDRVTKLEKRFENLYNQVNDPKNGMVIMLSKHEYQINDGETGLEPRVAALEEAKRKADEARAKAIENAKKRRGMTPAERLAKLEQTTKDLQRDKADKVWVQQQLDLRNGKAPDPEPQTVRVTPTDKGGHGVRRVGD